MRCHSLPRREVFRGCSWVFRGFPSRWVKWRETPRKSLLLTMVALSGFEPELKPRSRLRHFCRVVTLSEAAKNPVRLKHERVILAPRAGLELSGRRTERRNNSGPKRWLRSNQLRQRTLALTFLQAGTGSATAGMLGPHPPPSPAPNVLRILSCSTVPLTIPTPR